MVVFQSSRDGNIELYLTDSEGKAQTRLTNTHANNINPMFGPDNQSIVYQSDRNGNWDIYVLNVKTGEERQLTTDPADDVNPYWSPDPNHIIFQSNRTGSWNIYTLDLSTGTENTVSNYSYDAEFPTWSPNGKQISFISNSGGRWNLYVSDLQLSNTKQLTNSGLAGNASWSPEGNRIAYQIDRGNSETTVYSYDLTTDKQYKLTSYIGMNSAPTWDCGGSNISFTSTSSGAPNIFSVPWQGGTISAITTDQTTNKWAEWSPSKELGSLGY